MLKKLLRWYFGVSLVLRLLVCFIAGAVIGGGLWFLSSRTGLPMFAVLAANLFGIDLTMGGLAVLVITTVLASIGAGGVPGGSLMLLFVILEMMGLSAEQVAIVVALALGINPILDMFETMNNVMGDIVCTYAVAHNEGLLDETE